MNIHCRLFNISKILYFTKNNIKIRQILQLTPTSSLTLQCNNIYTNKTDFKGKKNETNIFETIVSKIPFLNISQNRLKVSGYLLYESVADNISYGTFFKEFSLPDTFYSWFVVTELHVWMLLARTMAEGDNGRLTRNSIVQALWSDVNTRVKKLGAANPSGLRMQVDELSQQFQAALISYDEGLLSNDKVLASALWRRFFQQQCTNPEHIELLVKYVRKQMKLLDDISPEDLLERRKVTWTSINTK